MPTSYRSSASATAASRSVGGQGSELGVRGLSQGYRVVIRGQGSKSEGSGVWLQSRELGDGPWFRVRDQESGVGVGSRVSRCRTLHRVS